MREVQKPKDLRKRKRLEQEEQRTREAVRMLCNAVPAEYPGDGVPLYAIVEQLVLPHVRAMSEALSATRSTPY